MTIEGMTGTSESCTSGFKTTQINDHCLVRLAHATNVTLKNILLDGGSDYSNVDADDDHHLVEVAAINGFKVTNCKIINNKRTQTSIGANACGEWEAIQLDIPCSIDKFRAYISDGYPMKNVDITGCYFSNVSRGVGSHSSIRGIYFENVNINNNKFYNITDEAIATLAYYNCTIKDNIIVGGRGIFVYSTRPYGKAFYLKSADACDLATRVKQDLKTTISGNTITVTTTNSAYSEAVGINVDGAYLKSSVTDSLKQTVPAGDYTISGVTIKGNTIKTNAFGIRVRDIKSSTISGNTITKTGTHTNKSSNYNGIMVSNLGDIPAITSGVAVTGNTISGCRENGICVDKSAVASKITGNTISSVGAYGIIINAGIVSGDISSNTITSCKGSGILTRGGTVKGNISSNKISTVTEHGIAIHSSSTVSKNVSSNKITSAGSNGIYVSQSKVKGNVSSNTVSTCSKGSGIHLYNGATVTGSISSNTIKGIKTSSQRAIFFHTKSTAGSIKNNTISSVAGQGINISSLKNSITISGNKISSCSAQSMYLNPATTSYTMSVNSNTITGKTSQYGIQIGSGKATISSNTIKSTKNPVYFSTSAKGSIYYNTLSSNKSNKYKIGSKEIGNLSTTSVSSLSTASKTITAKVKQVKGSTGYKIQSSKYSNYSSAKTTTLKGVDNTKSKITGLTKGKKYYVRARRYKAVGNVNIFSKYSATKTKTCK